MPPMPTPVVLLSAGGHRGTACPRHPAEPTLPHHREEAAAPSTFPAEYYGLEGGEKGWRPNISGEAEGRLEEALPSAHTPFPVPRQTQEAQVLKQLAEKREHEREVIQKAIEENNNFIKMAKEKLAQKMESNKENREAHLAAMLERLQEKVRPRRGWKGEGEALGHPSGHPAWLVGWHDPLGTPPKGGALAKIQVPPGRG